MPKRPTLPQTTRSGKTQKPFPPNSNSQFLPTASMVLINSPSSLTPFYSPVVWAGNALPVSTGSGEFIWAAGTDKITHEGSCLGEWAGSRRVINANQHYASLLEQMLGQPLQASDIKAGIQAGVTHSEWNRMKATFRNFKGTYWRFCNKAQWMLPTYTLCY